MHSGGYVWLQSVVPLDVLEGDRDICFALN